MLIVNFIRKRKMERRRGQKSSLLSCHQGKRSVPTVFKFLLLALAR